MTDMQEQEAAIKAPLIRDPGEEGWAAEVKVTQPELLLYGDFAGVVRLVGEAAAAAESAYSLACKRATEAWSERTMAMRDDLARRAWHAYDAIRRAHLDIAKAAMAERAEIVATQAVNDGGEPPKPASPAEVAGLS